MTLRERIQFQFGLDLPVSGGKSNSIDDAIVVHREGLNDYVGVEHAYLQCMAVGRGITWELVGQALMEHNDRKIDRITIRTTLTTDTEVIRQMENFYFDITECIAP